MGWGKGQVFMFLHIKGQVFIFLWIVRQWPDRIYSGLWPTTWGNLPRKPILLPPMTAKKASLLHARFVGSQTAISSNNPGNQKTTSATVSLKCPELD